MAARILRRPQGATRVDKYLAQVPEPERTVLARLRAQIRKAAPQAEEVIAYGMPTYRYRGMLIHFAVQPRHLALYGVSREALKALRDDLAGFDVAGRTIRFSAAKPLPAGLVARIVKGRVRENEAAARP